MSSCIFGFARDLLQRINPSRRASPTTLNLVTSSKDAVSLQVPLSMIFPLGQIGSKSTRFELCVLSNHYHSRRSIDPQAS